MPGAGVPSQIEAGRLITRFGVQAVFGRPMTMREMREINLAENVERAYTAEQRAEQSEGGAAEWSRNNRALAGLLARALKAYHAIED